MPYDTSNLQNVTNYLAQQRASGAYVPTNGALGNPSMGWDGWNSYKPSMNYTTAAPAQSAPVPQMNAAQGTVKNMQSTAVSPTPVNQTATQMPNNNGMGRTPNPQRLQHDVNKHGRVAWGGGRGANSSGYAAVQPLQQTLSGIPQDAFVDDSGGQPSWGQQSANLAGLLQPTGDPELDAFNKRVFDAWSGVLYNNIQSQSTNIPGLGYILNSSLNNDNRGTWIGPGPGMTNDQINNGTFSLGNGGLNYLPTTPPKV